MWSLAKNHWLTWQVAGVWTWALEAFPLTLLYPNWASDLKSNVLVPGWEWASEYVVALVELAGDVFSTA